MAVLNPRRTRAIGAAWPELVGVLLRAAVFSNVRRRAEVDEESPPPIETSFVASAMAA